MSSLLHPHPYPYLYLHSHPHTLTLTGTLTLTLPLTLTLTLTLTLQDTRHFAITGVDNQSPRNPLPFGAYGTLSDLNDTSREEFLDQCPELKMLYPPMHSPLCFGAIPDPLGCFKYVTEFTFFLHLTMIVIWHLDSFIKWCRVDYSSLHHHFTGNNGIHIFKRALSYPRRSYYFYLSLHFLLFHSFV
jgi:hypothetical protein